MSLDLEWKIKFKYSITLNSPNYTEIETWCTEHFGEFGDRWYKLGLDPAGFVMSHLGVKTVWYFTDENDFIYFSLRWL